ncbi:hypothetical protein NDI85_21060 [Halomicroarcula sp. S1AR25-4]|uniref:hypothetical protein n=1 Tax=Haloarcula sp. S1AR25-4 TaxID=2950538 RepID=UPI00287689EF|nr:hypothetical protein [Halomicroarcula sp. S1AR25-4]MDS0280277.1 hypothetical protein [Halomicroarcula sp. S1AR25-4]
MATADNPPREPSAYRPTFHFTQRFHDRYEDDRPPRHLDDEIVATCITDGAVTKADPGTVWFRATFGGVTYRLVVDVDVGEVVTGYPISINTEAARDSGRWTSEQIEDIREFIATDPRSDGSR